jgi:hypothetical protein
MERLSLVRLEHTVQSGSSERLFCHVLTLTDTAISRRRASHPRGVHYARDSTPGRTAYILQS